MQTFQNFEHASFKKENVIKVKAHIAPHTIIVGVFYTLLYWMDRSGKHKSSRDKAKLPEVSDQMDLTDIYRTFHPKSKEYAFFSVPHGTFSKIDYIIGHKQTSTEIRRLK